MPRILVIDDNVALLQSLDYYLQSEGYTVIQAEDGQSGLRLAAEQSADVVMLDIEMPQMSGFAVCQTIRDDPALCRLPVLMMTGRATMENMERARAAGASVVMGKPFDLDRLKTTLAGLLEPAVAVSGTVVNLPDRKGDSTDGEL